jgi:putative ABC transport system permease protein
VKQLLDTLAYELRLAGKSLRRDRWFTVIMVVSQALSVSLFVTALATYRRFSRAGHGLGPAVFRIESDRARSLDSYYSQSMFEGYGAYTAFLVSVPTARALAGAGLADAESVLFGGAVTGGTPGAAPRRIAARFCNADLFALFHVRFRYGGPWARDDERASPPAPVLAISDVLNQSLFGGRNSVGEIVRLSGRDFRVGGVMRPPEGSSELWDINNPPENVGGVMLPFAFADALRPEPVHAWPPVVVNRGWDALRASQHRFVEYWLHFPSSEARERYARVLAGVDPELELRPAGAVLAFQAQAPGPFKVFLVFTVVIMLANVINLMRMLLAKARGRAGEIGVHRALGAPRETIFARQLLEGTTVAMAGSLLGILLGLPSTRLLELLVPDSPMHAAMTLETFAITLGASLLASVLGGALPAWRVATVPPTRYLGKV